MTADYGTVGGHQNGVSAKGNSHDDTEPSSWPVWDNKNGSKGKQTMWSTLQLRDLPYNDGDLYRPTSLPGAVLYQSPHEAILQICLVFSQTRHRSSRRQPCQPLSTSPSQPSSSRMNVKFAVAEFCARRLPTQRRSVLELFLPGFHSSGRPCGRNPPMSSLTG